jgi:hypothetical protein
MQPLCWQPPVELSAQEEQIVARIRRAKLFVFLRKYRHELFNEAFRAANSRACIARHNEDVLQLPRRC